MRPTIDETYLAMLPVYAARGTCIRRQVSAIITDKKGRVLGAGFNGVPRGVVHCRDIPCKGATDQAGDTRNCEAVHAEANALLQCHDLNEARVMYCSCSPCFECAKMILNTNIERIVVAESYADVRGEQALVRGGRIVVTGSVGLARK